MKKYMLILIVLVVTVNSCVSAHSAILNDLWADITKDRTIRLGMTKDEVLDLWGNPDVTESDTWIYVWSKGWPNLTPIGTLNTTNYIFFKDGVVIKLGREKTLIRNQSRKTFSPKQLTDENKGR